MWKEVVDKILLLSIKKRLKSENQIIVKNETLSVGSEKSYDFGFGH